MSEMMDAMRAAGPEKVHPPGTKICFVCTGKGWLTVPFQAEFCNDRNTEQSRICLECGGTGVMADDRWAMLGLQGKRKPELEDHPENEGKMVLGHGRFRITFPKTYVWTGLDWIEYDSPFYAQAKAQGRAK